MRTEYAHQMMQDFNKSAMTQIMTEARKREEWVMREARNCDTPERKTALLLDAEAFRNLADAIERLK